MRVSSLSGRRLTRYLWYALGASLLAAAMACGIAASDRAALAPASSDDPSNINQDSAASIEKVNIFAVPMLDTSKASVPLNDIVFDTFGRVRARYVPLDEADAEFILELRDAIAPIYQPVYGSGADLPWLSDYDLVMGYVSGNDAYAYPINILNNHELVNDEIDGIPVLVSYCPLCVSGVVYNRELNNQVLLFGNTSALYQSDLVMYDHQSGSYWFQVGGEAVVGELTGAHLDLMPSTTVAWQEWKALYPDTRVLVGTSSSPSQFSSRRYGQGFSPGYKDRIEDEKFLFPVDSDLLDRRLSSSDLVLTVEVDESATAYPLDRIGDAAVNDQVGGRPVVVFSRENGRAVGAFFREMDGRSLTFDYDADSNSFVDRETQSVWDAAGRAIDGPLAGKEMERTNTRRAFWFSIAITLPDVQIYAP